MLAAPGRDQHKKWNNVMYRPWPINTKFSLRINQSLMMNKTHGASLISATIDFNLIHFNLVICLKMEKLFWWKARSKNLSLSLNLHLIAVAFNAYFLNAEVITYLFTIATISLISTRPQLPKIFAPPIRSLWVSLLVLFLHDWWMNLGHEGPHWLLFPDNVVLRQLLYLCWS